MRMASLVEGKVEEVITKLYLDNKEAFVSLEKTSFVKANLL